MQHHNEFPEFEGPNESTAEVPTEEVSELRPVRGLAEMVSMWPGGRRAFIAGLGIRPADFKAWLDGHKQLDRHATHAIYARANLHVESDGVTAGGGGLLIASRRKALSTAYELLMAGGQVALSREIVSPEGRPSAWRFLLFQRSQARACIVLVEPGSIAGNALSSRNLPGFAGSVFATKAVWNSVHFIVRNHEHLLSPGTAGIDFEAIHSGWMKALQTGSGAKVH